jgi:AcrR family transcriptional regulator
MAEMPNQTPRRLAERAGDRPLRQDAQRNRGRLLAAASEVFADRGLDVTMHDIAAHAGVGVGTAYRRFANKDQIIDALFTERLDQIAALATQALEDPDAWHGLTTFLENSLRLQLEDRGLMEILNNPKHAHRLDVANERIAPLITAIVDRARDQGKLRPDFQPTDVIFVQLALTALMDRTRDLNPTLYRRYLTMLLDGLRADRGPLSPLPVDAFSVDQTQAAMKRGREDFRHPAPTPKD